MANKVFIDQMGRKVEINTPPKRIISLVPSQTELLYDLGLDQEIVGQTLFCIHPKDKHETKQRVGGTKKINLDTIASLSPDLIIGNKEENDKNTIEQLMMNYPVWMSDIQNLDDALQMINMVGELVDRNREAADISNNISNGFKQLKTFEKQTSIAYLIWRKPWMVAGHDTFINHMITRMGGTNVFQHEDSRYPQITDDQIFAAEPDVILLSSEPYPFKEKHIKELQQISAKSKVMMVDGELFSWYGSRLLKSVSYFNELINHLQIIQ